jgi:hypothetical protein
MDSEAKMERVRQIAEAINRRISASSSPRDLADRVEATFQEVLETYRGRDWPSVAIFADCAKVTAPKQGSGGALAGEWSLDPVGINSRRIQRGDAVGDEWIYGRRAVEAIQSGQITEDNLRPYRSGLFFHVRDTLGNDEALRRERQYQLKHDAARAGAGLAPIFSLQMEAAE